MICTITSGNVLRICAPSEDSGQLAHSRSLNRVFTCDCQRCIFLMRTTKTLFRMRLSLSVGRENGPEWGLKTVLFNLSLSVILANSADPDQTPRSAASNLGLRCFPTFQSKFYRYGTLTSQQQKQQCYK